MTGDIESRYHRSLVSATVSQTKIMFFSLWRRRAFCLRWNHHGSGSCSRLEVNKGPITNTPVVYYVHVLSGMQSCGSIVDGFLCDMVEIVR